MLAPSDLATIRQILIDIDEGGRVPQIAGPVGRYLRQYGTAQSLINRLCDDAALRRREDGAVSGRILSSISLSALRAAKVRQPSLRLGEVAETIVLCEELGVALTLVMWLKAKNAKETYDQITDSSISLQGDYRWYPLTRLTPGDSEIVSGSRTLHWSDARFLKSTADDLNRRPHALEYFYDDKYGLPNLKFFRCVVAESVNRSLRVLGVKQEPRFVEFQVHKGSTTQSFDNAGFVSCLVYREPWNERWTLAATRAISIEKAFEHLYVWHDFRQELLGEPTGTTDVGSFVAINGRQMTAVDVLSFSNLERRLFAVARSAHALLRGLSNPA